MKKKIFLGLGIFLLIGLGVSSFLVFGTYSDGYRAGNVVKLSKKGYVIKTYEGQLNVGGFTEDEDGDIGTNMWEFSVRKGNDQVIRDLERAVDEGHRVKLRYKEKYFQFNIFGDTKYFVYEVEEVLD